MLTAIILALVALAFGTFASPSAEIDFGPHETEDDHIPINTTLALNRILESTAGKIPFHAPSMAHIWSLSDGNTNNTTHASYANNTTKRSTGQITFSYDSSCSSSNRGAISAAWEQAKYLASLIDAWEPGGDYQYYVDVYLGMDSISPDKAKAIKQISGQVLDLFNSRAEEDTQITIFCGFGGGPLGESCTGDRDSMQFAALDPDMPEERYMAFCPAWFAAEDLHERMKILKEGHKKACYNTAIMEFYLGTQAQTLLHMAVQSLLESFEPEFQLTMLTPVESWGLARNGAYYAMQNPTNWALLALTQLSADMGMHESAPRPSWNKHLPAVGTVRKFCPKNAFFPTSLWFLIQSKVKDHYQRYQWWTKPVWMDAPPFNHYPGFYELPKDKTPHCPGDVLKKCHHLPGWSAQSKRMPGVWYEDPWSQRPHAFIRNHKEAPYQVAANAHKNLELNCDRHIEGKKGGDPTLAKGCPDGFERLRPWQHGGDTVGDTLYWLHDSLYRLFDQAEGDNAKMHKPALNLPMQPADYDRNGE